MKLLALVESPDHVCCRYRIRAFAPSAPATRAGPDVCRGSSDGPCAGSFQLRRASQFDAVILAAQAVASLAVPHPAPGCAASRLRLRRRGAFPRFVRPSRSAERLAVPTVRADRAHGRHGRRRQRLPGRLRTASRGQGRASPRDPDLRRTPSVIRWRGTRNAPRPMSTWSGSARRARSGAWKQSRPIWERLAKAIPRLRLRVICDRFPQPFPLPVVCRSPGRGQTEARELAAGQIGVSWLPDDLWSRGKCGLKVLQYQAAGLPVVANPVGATAR